MLKKYIGMSPRMITGGKLSGAGFDTTIDRDSIEEQYPAAHQTE